MHSQRKVLLCWEQGHNLGHLTRLISLAWHVAQSGYEPILALPQGYINAPILAGLPYKRIPAPHMHLRPTPSHVGTKRPKSFADILLAFGFGNAEILKPQVLAWLQVYERIQPTSLILDYAPAAQLAALICQLPAMQITNGFDAPPPNCPVFGKGVRGPYLERLNSQTIEGIDEVLITIANQLGSGLKPTLQSLLQYPSMAYECIPETDLYSPRCSPADNYIGPIVQPPNTDRIPAGQWATSNRPKVFVYLRERQVVNTVLQALETLNAAVMCVYPEASDEMIAEHAASPRIVQRHPVALTDVLAQADAVVNYGSSSVSCQTLLAGKPQLCVPTDTEKWLLSQRLIKQGLALACIGTESSRHWQDILRNLLDDPSLKTRTRHIASNHKNTNWGDVQSQFVRQFAATTTARCAPPEKDILPNIAA